MIRANSLKTDLRPRSLNISLPDLDNAAKPQQERKVTLSERKRIHRHKSLTSGQMLQPGRSLPLGHIQGNKISSNLKETLTEQSFNKLKTFSADQQIDILASTAANESINEKFTKISIISSQKIPNLKLSNNKNKPARSMSLRKVNAESLFVKADKEKIKRLMSESFTEEVELKKYKSFMNKPSYTANENRNLSTGGPTNSVLLSSSRQPQNIDGFHASLLASEDPVPKQGSLLKYFRDGLTKSKSTQMFKQMVRAKSGLGFRERKNMMTQEDSAPRDIFTNKAISNLMAGGSGEAQQNSQPRPSTGGVLRKTEEGLIINKSEEPENEPEYIQSFVQKVKNYIKQKAECLETHEVHSITYKDAFDEEPSPTRRTAAKKSRDQTSTRRSVGLDTTNASSDEKPTATMSCPKLESHELIKKKLFQQNSLPESRNSMFRNTPDDWINHGDEQDLDILEIPDSAGSNSDSDEEKPEFKKIIRPNKVQAQAQVQAEENKRQSDDDYLISVKTKSQQIEEYIISNAINMNRAYDKYDYAFGISQAIEMRGGIIPKTLKLNRRSSKQFLSERNELKEVYGEMSKLEETIIEDKKMHEKFYSTREVALEKALLVRPDYLTQSELTFVRAFFQSKEAESFSKLDGMLARLRFFSLLPKEARLELYKHANYFKQEAGSYIYREGEIGDSLYIVLKGSVNIKSQRVLEDGQVHIITVASLGDGSHFGDVAEMSKEKQTEDEEDDSKRRQVFATKVKTLAEVRAKNQEYDELERKKELEVKMMNESSRSQLRERFNLLENKKTEQVQDNAANQTKRTSSIQCAEPCEVLVLEKDKYQKILSEILNKDITNKLNLINLIPFFKEVEKQSLIPMTTNLRKLKFKLGQRVIREGEIVMNFYILAKGKCTVVKEIVDDRRVGRDHYKTKLRSLHFKDFEKKKDSENQEQSVAAKKDENVGVDTKAMDHQINEVVEKVAGDNVHDQEVLRERLKPFKFDSLITILSNERNEKIN